MGKKNSEGRMEKKQESERAAKILKRRGWGE